jgi:FkbM family methyltransferase
MGEFNIDSFEPSLKNNIRTCESIRLNNWENEWEQEASGVPRKTGSPAVNVWNAGVSDLTGTFKFYESHGNPGASRFGYNGGFGGNRTDYTELPVTTLDTFAEERSWFESRPEIAILQIDVEQDNPNVLVGAQKLLKSGIVQNVFTEVKLRDDSVERAKELAAHKLIVEAGYKLKGHGGWSGPGKDNMWGDGDVNLVKDIFDYHEKDVKGSLTLWWAL